MSYHVLLACHFIVFLDSFQVNDVINLCAAHKKTDSCAAHEVLLMCFLQSCSTRNIARVHYMKVNSHVTREFGLSHSTKIEEDTCVPHMRVPT